MYRRIFFVLFAISIALIGYSADAYQIERGFSIIDYPNTNVPPHASYSISLRLQPYGGMLIGFHLGLFERFLLSMEYGGTGFIGYGTFDPNPLPGMDIRFSIKDDDYYTPAIAVGFNSQGYGRYTGSRYEIKSPGLYLIITKTAYFVFGNMYLSLGINYSMENDTDNDPNGYAGITLYFPQGFAFLSEYNTGINDDQTTAGRGYLGMGMKWIYMNNLQIMFVFRDLLNNGGNGINRVLSIMYTSYF